MITYNKEQQLAIRYFNQSQNNSKEIYSVSGAAGTGKSTVIGGIVDIICATKPNKKLVWFTDKTTGEPSSFEVASSFLILTPTGIAAQNVKSKLPAEFDINIMTLHKLLHLTFTQLLKLIPEDATETQLQDALAEAYKLTFNTYKFKHINHILVDEVSMVHRLYLEMLIYICRFHNIKLSLFGDFYQLPPVPLTLDEIVDEDNDIFEDEKTYHSTTSDFISIINKFPHYNIQLTQVMRTDEFDFTSALSDYRNLKFAKLLNFNFNTTEQPYLLDATNIFYSNAEVKFTNTKIQNILFSESDKLPTTRQFILSFAGTTANATLSKSDQLMIDNLIKVFNVMPTAHKGYKYVVDPELKKVISENMFNEQFSLLRKQMSAFAKNIGMGISPVKFYDDERVMWRKNYGTPMVLANGEIKKYDDIKDIVMTEFIIFQKKYKLMVNFTPITLAYAFTTHKTQGIGISGKLYINVDSLVKSGQIFYNMLYVALSRKKNDTTIFLNRPLQLDDFNNIDRNSITALNNFFSK